VNWTAILKAAGIPEPPGREELVLRMKWDVPLPPKQGKKKGGKRK
jgi:hypothetical protein